MIDILAHTVAILLVIAVLVAIVSLVFYGLVRPILLGEWGEVAFFIGVVLLVVGVKWFSSWYDRMYG